MKKLIILWVLAACCWACETKQEVIDTGISNAYFDGTMMDYLRSHSKNWDFTVQLIEHADLVDLFEGKVDSCPEITFWAPPSYAIERFLWESQKEQIAGKIYSKVTDLPQKKCREFILNHVVKGKYLKEDIGYMNKDYVISDERQDGGTRFSCLGGHELLACQETSAWAGVADAGPVSLRLYSVTQKVTLFVATTNIQPDNGVVHALHYTYDFGRMFSE